MKIKSVFSLLLFLLIAFQLKAQPARIRQNFDDQWKFNLGDVYAARNTEYNDASWSVLNLPHDWNIELPFDARWASSTAYLPSGIGWYRKSFQVPDSYKDKVVSILFDGVYNNSDVWINGHHLGKRPSGYTSFQYELTPYLVPGKTNTIAVRVDHSLYADSRWYTGSGIYRHVWLNVTDKIHVAQWGAFVTTPVITKEMAKVSVENTIENASGKAQNLEIISVVFGKEGKEISRDKSVKSLPAGQSFVKQEIIVKNPVLWDVESPNMYTVKTTLSVDGKIVDEVSTPFGIRSFNFDKEKGFFLNGKNMKLKGVCIHHDGGCVGAAVPEKIWKIRLEKLKAGGCNAIRTSHNPVAPELLDLCDQMGFLVMDEAFDEWEYSKRKWIDGWNQTIAGFDGSARYFDEWSERDLKDMINRDKNHPSIILWSIGNEIDYANDPYADNQDVNYTIARPDAARMLPVAKNLSGIIKAIDTTRPVTMALANIRNSNSIGLPEVLDIVGYNYTESQYAPDHKAYPDRLIFGSENPQNYTGWLAVKNNDYISAQFLWTGIDYLGEGGKFPARSAYSGLLDLTNNEKTIYYWRQSMWSEKPMISLAARKKKATDTLDADPMGKMAWFLNEIEEKLHWNYTVGDTVLVMAYSNCKDVELFINGKSYGKKQQNEANSCFWWYVPYQAGEVKAIGTGSDKKKYPAVLNTVFEPAQIQLIPDTSFISSDGKDMVLVEAILKDKNNNTSYLATNRIEFTVSGEGTIIGTDNGDAKCVDSFKLPWKKAYAGRCIVMVQSTKQAGKISISATSEGLPVKTIQVESGLK
ncbi:MAG: glycoside hydrolase family 2 TIM barrel-domain containing protein [Bacteroidales bacterium]|nr:glycoside hydrolase family 2 TIM barrel-domain containing protein [Bacteroidales bacterium]